MTVPNNAAKLQTIITAAAVPTETQQLWQQQQQQQEKIIYINKTGSRAENISSNNPKNKLLHYLKK